MAAKKLKRISVTVRSQDREAIRACAATQNVDEVIELTRHESCAVRVAALREMCPCHVKADVPDFWRRVFEMATDDDLAVRKQVMHTVCDGSPATVEAEVMAVVEAFSHDRDTDLRRLAHKIIASYRRTGKWNVL